MPALVIPSTHVANPVVPHFAGSASEVLTNACPFTREQPFEIIQSSLGEGFLPPALKPSSNGLLYSLIDAYSSHHHLTLRPEDVWLAVLTQFSLYINAHAEELRSKFVAHEGQKDLEVVYRGGTRWTVDFANFATQISLLIEQNVLDPDLRTWMMPGFSTSTRHDEVVASIVMMGSMQKYFTYTCTITCGIPSVTLLGEKEDWEKLLLKIDKLDEFGEEPTQFAELLRPIVRRFILSFDEPESRKVIDFWQRVMDVESGSGFTTYTGWMTAFAFWNEDGQHKSYVEGSGEYSENGDFGDKIEEKEFSEGQKYQIHSHKKLHLSLDGVRYHHVSDRNIPPGWTKVPVNINDNGEKVEAEMVAGSIGISCSSSGAADQAKSGDGQLDSIQPETGWWIYEKKNITGAASNDQVPEPYLKGVSEQKVVF